MYARSLKIHLENVCLVIEISPRKCMPSHIILTSKMYFQGLPKNTSKPQFVIGSWERFTYILYLNNIEIKL